MKTSNQMSKKVPQIEPPTVRNILTTYRVLQKQDTALDGALTVAHAV